MQGKNIKYHLRKKIEDWANSIENEEVKSLVLNKTIITGGAIVSLLQGEIPHDYDVYFRDPDSLLKVASYCVEKYTSKIEGGRKPVVQRCVWSDTENKWVVVSGDRKPDERIRIFIASDGIAGINVHENAKEIEYRKDLAKTNHDVMEAHKASKEKRMPYEPLYMTNNAITLNNKIQLILRFYGEPEDIHENYDFIHCTSYWTSWNDNLVLPARALEAIINKELYYVGSKYPLCSIIRTRKFIKRGWTINAGQYVKMAVQLIELNLKNIHVFEEQLIGVDSAYFNEFLSLLEEKYHNDPDFDMAGSYLIDLINSVFDKECIDDFAGDVENGQEEENAL